MAVQLKRIAGAVRHDGKLVPIADGDPLPPPVDPGWVARKWDAIKGLWKA